MSQPVIHIRFRAFARYAELLGGETFAVELHQPATVADAVTALRSQVAAAARLPAKPLVAIDLEHVLPDRALVDGEELSLLPPLAGG